MRNLEVPSEILDVRQEGRKRAPEEPLFQLQISKFNKSIFEFTQNSLPCNLLESLRL
jgi:hypothetical protein